MVQELVPERVAIWLPLTFLPLSPSRWYIIHFIPFIPVSFNYKQSRESFRSRSCDSQRVA